MDRLDEFAIFVRIVEEGSLVRAAQRLRRSAPAVTRALAALEDRLGVRLIDRTTRRLAPTEAGRALYERARGVVESYEAATAGAREAPVRGLLRIAAPVQFGRRHVAPLAARFLDSHESVEIELLLNDRNVDLIEEGIDVAVRIGALADSSLVARPVGHVRRQWVASPAYLTRQGTPKVPADLAKHEALLGTSRGAMEWTFGGRRRGAPPHLAGRLRVDDIETRLRHRAVSLLPGRRGSRGRASRTPVAQLRAAAAAGTTPHQGPCPSCAEDRCLPRFRGQETVGPAHPSTGLTHPAQRKLPAAR